MTQEQRKIELINWITSLNNESILQRLEELKNDSVKDVSLEILALLEFSNNISEDKLIEHTSVRDILKK